MGRQIINACTLHFSDSRNQFFFFFFFNQLLINKNIPLKYCPISNKKHSVKGAYVSSKILSKSVQTPAPFYSVVKVTSLNLCICCICLFFCLYVRVFIGPFVMG